MRNVLHVKLKDRIRRSTFYQRKAFVQVLSCRSEGQMGSWGTLVSAAVNVVIVHVCGVVIVLLGEIEGAILVGRFLIGGRGKNNGLIHLRRIHAEDALRVISSSAEVTVKLVAPFFISRKSNNCLGDRMK